jgi:hypothetical protein
MPAKTNPKSQGSTTRAVGPEIFKQVYDSPFSLPGKHRWVTKDEDVRAIEKLLGIPDKSIGAPLWVSGGRGTAQSAAGKPTGSILFLPLLRKRTRKHYWLRLFWENASTSTWKRRARLPT